MVNPFPLRDINGVTQFFQAYSINEEFPEQGGVYLGIVHKISGLFETVYIDKTPNLKDRLSVPYILFELRRHGVNYILFQNIVQDDLRDKLFEDLNLLYQPTMNLDF
jgi:hypothetical protein